MFLLGTITAQMSVFITAIASQSTQSSWSTWSSWSSKGRGIVQLLGVKTSIYGMRSSSCWRSRVVRTPATSLPSSLILIHPLGKLPLLMHCHRCLSLRTTEFLYFLVFSQFLWLVPSITFLGVKQVFLPKILLRQPTITGPIGDFVTFQFLLNHLSLVELFSSLGFLARHAVPQSTTWRELKW